MEHKELLFKLMNDTHEQMISFKHKGESWIRISDDLDREISEQKDFVATLNKHLLAEESRQESLPEVWKSSLIPLHQQLLLETRKYGGMITSQRNAEDRIAIWKAEFEKLQEQLEEYIKLYKSL